ncbi:hypothetical protein [uncultured Nostoc sp.]|uniref:hypothetical protein n=1 Tax=uncultured Nostoc sp. TaxID=340711 RepID=UPI0035CB0DC5
MKQPCLKKGEESKSLNLSGSQCGLLTLGDDASQLLETLRERHGNAMSEVRASGGFPHEQLAWI